MAGKKKSGGKKGGGEGKKTPAPDTEHFIEFTPMGGFNIRTAAHHFSQIMESSGQPLVIHLPHISVEFEAGCTPKEIIEGYNQALKSKFVVRTSNANVKGAK
jgi:hypothetical protein